MNCEFCNRNCKNKSAYTTHSRSCLKNPDRILGHWETEGFKNKIKENRKTHPPFSQETKDKLSKITSDYYKDPKNRDKHSKAMKKAVLENPESYSSKNVCGRSKKFEVDGVLFHSTWEYEVSKYLDKANIKWERDIKPIPYFWNNKWHLYFPDFYLEAYDCYIEVKGYETDRDIAKWKYADKYIHIIRNNDIDKIKSGDYDFLCSYSQAVKAPTS